MLTLAFFDLLYILTSMLLFGMPALYPRYLITQSTLSTPGTGILKVTSLGARLLHHPQLHVSYKHGQCIRAEHAFVMALRHCATICTVYLGAKCDKKLRNGRNVATAFLYCPSLHKSYMIFLRQMLFLYGVNSHNCLYFTFAPPRQIRAQSPSSAEIS